MCLRVDQASPRAVVEGSIQSNCHDCEALVWVSVSGQKMLAEGGIHIICDGCFIQMEKSENDQLEIRIREEVIIESLRHLLSDAEKKRR